MERFTSSIQKALADENWFAALFLALAMPDICASVETPPTGARGEVGARYAAWFDRYLKNKYAPETMYDSMLAKHKEVLEKLPAEQIDYLKAMQFDPEMRFTAQDCYRFRCKCLHQGLPELTGGERFRFLAPPPHRSIIHMNVINGVRQLQIDVFCNDICAVVLEWQRDVAGRADVESRIAELIQIHQVTELPFLSLGPIPSATA